MKQRTAVQPSATGISDDWRRWIAENLVLGSHPDTLAGILRNSGIPAALAQAEIAAALASPYLHGAQRLHNRLAKRDWLLDIQGRLDRGPRMEPGIGASQGRPSKLTRHRNSAASRPWRINRGLLALAMGGVGVLGRGPW